MSRKLLVEISDKEYTFALDRKELKRGEKIGLNLKDMESSPTTQVSIFWNVGLRKYQPTLSNDKCEELLEAFIDEGGEISEIMEFLSTEYASFFQTTRKDSKKPKSIRVVEE